MNPLAPLDADRDYQVTVTQLFDGSRCLVDQFDDTGKSDEFARGEFRQAQLRPDGLAIQRSGDGICPFANQIWQRRQLLEFDMIQTFGSQSHGVFAQAGYTGRG